MSQQSVRQAARRSALDAQAVLRKERADRERRLEALAVAVLTALGERDRAVRDAERRAGGGALLAMTDDERLSAREAADWCGSGVTVREVTRLRRLVDLDSGRVGKVNEFRAHLALADLCGLSLRPASHQGLVTRCWELRESLTAYDASYIALAEMLGATLVTTDVRMSSASQRLRTVADWRRPDWHQLPSTARTPWHPAITGLPDVRRPPSTAIRFRRRGKSTEARDR
jgi:predicted nucleic acid-binding protein